MTYDEALDIVKYDCISYLLKNRKNNVAKGIEKLEEACKKAKEFDREQERKNNGK